MKEVQLPPPLPLPPPRRLDTFQNFVDKIAWIRKRGYSVEVQLATIDYWIGKLFDLKSQIEGRRRN